LIVGEEGAVFAFERSCLLSLPKFDL